MSQQFALAGNNTLVAPGVGQAANGLLDGVLAQRERARAEGLTIAVEVAAGARLFEIESDWLGLLGRADSPNVFMNPTRVRLAEESYSGGHCRALLAWNADKQLVGVWAFAIGRAAQSILPVSVLSAPPMPHGYLATPVIDRDCLDEVLEAMLDQIVNDPSMPKIVAIDAIGADCDTMQALNRVLAKRGSAACVLNRSQRPKLFSALDGKRYLEKALSNSSRKKLRQHRRRLAEKGTVRFEIVTEADAVNRAFGDFLKLEASGWKGRQGTALLSNSSDASFATAMIAGLAARGEASIHALTLDGRQISMQIVLRAGPAAFTWKTAYDEAMREFSPGMLLLEDYTAAFLADKSIAYVDSCAIDDSGYMSAWTERDTITRLWIDARRGSSASFVVCSWLQVGYLRLRDIVKKLYVSYAKRRAR